MDSESESAPSASLLLCRPVRDQQDEHRGVEESHLYELNAIFDVSEEQFDSWTSIELRLLLDSASRMAQWSVNRPGITELRAADREFYTLLTSRVAAAVCHCFPGGVAGVAVATPMWW